MQLLIVRHGEAVSIAPSDAQRALTERGREQARAAGECLAGLSWRPQSLWVSPYLRAQQTAEEIVLVLGRCQTRQVDQLTPETPPSELLEQLIDADLERLMLVSHQPLVSALIGVLTQGQPAMGAPMMTASMALLEGPVMARGAAELVWLRHAPLFEKASW